MRYSCLQAFRIAVYLDNGLGVCPTFADCCSQSMSVKTDLFEGDMGICGVAVLMFFSCGDVVNKISTCGVAVISNPMVCDVCVFHAAMFGEMKLFAVLWFLVCSFSGLNLACKLC